MESFKEIWDYISANVLPHWPFIVGYFGFVLFGQFAKAQIWTKERATTKGKYQKLFHFMRRTLSVHAPIMGIVAGMVPHIPASPGVHWMSGTVLYWFGIGVAASFSFHALSEWVNSKWGVDLEASIEDAVSPSMTPDE